MASAPQRREVLLYGMSANPPTGLQGHMGAITYCAALGFDEVWILPVYQHIYSTKRALAPFEHRVQMCQLAIDALPPRAQAQAQAATEREGKVSVKEYERELFEHLAQATAKPQELRIGSIDLIRYLLERFPEASFTMLLGADTFADLEAGKWKSGDELKELVKLLVMSRQGYDAPSTTDFLASDRIRFVTIPSLGDISSTYVRSVGDPNELQQLVAPQVAEYIMQHRLYAFANQ